MRISVLVVGLGALLSVVGSTPLQKADVDYVSVRSKQRGDLRGQAGDVKHKYFHESRFHPHYDARFTKRRLPYVEQKLALKNLAQTFLETFSDIKVETWLAHGSLLGWWWNKQIMPWDSDMDVQVTEASMYYLAAYYNMSIFHYKTPRIPEGRDYMLEINPHYINREQTDKLNVIDARWIDTVSGLFIDITTARYNLTHPEGEGMMSCKDGHEFRDTYIFPLRNTVFEGVPAKIPYRYKDLLVAEYGEKALTKKEHSNHVFDEEKMEWIPKMMDINLDDLKRDQKMMNMAKGRGRKEAKKEAKKGVKKGEKENKGRVQAAKQNQWKENLELRQKLLPYLREESPNSQSSPMRGRD